MAKLYKQYCYRNIGVVRKTIESEMLIEGYGIIQSVSSSASVITVDYLKPDNTLSSYQFTPPTCFTLGFDNSYTGISTSDAIEIGTLVTIALVIAYAAKITRRAI